MKQFSKILATVLALAFAQGARASVNPNDQADITANQGNDSLDEVQAMMERLREAKALEVDQDGNVRVKPSVLEKLRAQGRLVEMAGSYSSICN